MLRRHWVPVIVILLFAVAAPGAQAVNQRPGAVPASLRALTVPGRPGETCVILIGARNVPLMLRCTSGYVSG